MSLVSAFYPSIRSVQRFSLWCFLEKMESKVVKLRSVEATPERFEEYGEVIEASPDGFTSSTFKIGPLKFSAITHHASVTQCPGSIGTGGHVWYLGVVKPSIVDSGEVQNGSVGEIVQSKCGHVSMPPAIDDVVFSGFLAPSSSNLTAGHGMQAFLCCGRYNGLLQFRIE